MKPYELYQQWSQFEAMLANKSIADEDKLNLGREWVAALPPPQLCVSSTLSRVAVGNAMTGRLNDLKEKIYGSTTGTEAKETKGSKAGQESTQSKKRPSKKSV